MVVAGVTVGLALNEARDAWEAARASGAERGGIPGQGWGRAADDRSASSVLRFCSVACEGDGRLPELPIHPNDPQETFLTSIAHRLVSEWNCPMVRQLAGSAWTNVGIASDVS